MTYEDILAKRSDRTIKEDVATQPHVTAVRCTTCGRVLDDSTWRAEQRRWVCPGYPGDGMDEHTAAALRLGPFARPFDPARDYERVPMEGYVQIGPTSYERIADPDWKLLVQKI